MTEAVSQVLCIGETMAMVTPSDSMPMATAETFSISPGGAESNVAHHLATLGVSTAWVSALGADPLGDRVLATLNASGVDTRWVIRDPDAHTGLYVKDPGKKVYYYRAGSAASRLAAEHVAGWPIASARWVHLTGITPALSETCRTLVPAVIEAARGSGVRVSFDVNYRPALWPAAQAAATIQPLADRADVVLVGRDEAEVLWGATTVEGIADVFPHSPRIVVKDSDVEAVEVDRTQGDEIVTRVPAQAVEIVEPVGAGDAFAGGYLAALLHGASAEQRLAQGHSLAVWVLGSPHDIRPGFVPSY